MAKELPEYPKGPMRGFPSMDAINRAGVTGKQVARKGQGKALAEHNMRVMSERTGIKATSPGEMSAKLKARAQAAASDVHYGGASEAGNDLTREEHLDRTAIQSRLQSIKDSPGSLPRPDRLKNLADMEQNVRASVGTKGAMRGITNVLGKAGRAIGNVGRAVNSADFILPKESLDKASQAIDKVMSPPGTRGGTRGTGGNGGA